MAPNTYSSRSTRIAVSLVRSLRSERGFVGIGVLISTLFVIGAIGVFAHIARTNSRVVCPYALPSVLATKLSGTTQPAPDTRGCSFERMASAYGSRVKEDFSQGLWEEV